MPEQLAFVLGDSTLQVSIPECCQEAADLFLRLYDLILNLFELLLKYEMGRQYSLVRLHALAKEAGSNRRLSEGSRVLGHHELSAISRYHCHVGRLARIK